jgi:hypothetical protein
MVNYLPRSQVVREPSLILSKKLTLTSVGVFYLKKVYYLCVVEDSEKIMLLEDEVVELRFSLKDSKTKEMFYLDILNNIDSSISDLFKQEEENERFRLNEEIDYRECLINLKKSLNEYKRVYRINF